MPSRAAEPLQFKFHWLDENGQPSGFLRKRGSFDGDTVVLDDISIPAGVITQVEVREGRLFLAALAEGGRPAVLGISLSQRNAGELKSALDIARSEVWAQMHRKELQKDGRSTAYRDQECPNCNATIILTDMPKSPQLYCQFCDTLMTIDAATDPPAGERELKICDECGMFSKPKKFTIFYFYFLLFVYGWSQRSTWRCPACMRGDAWKMLFGNLIFVLGVPVAIAQLLRSYGSSVIGGPFRGLDAANLKARKGDLMGALEGYRSILESVPRSAGVKFNLGRSLLEQGETARAAESFRLALNDCANYAPAYGMLAHCYEQLGETEKLAELRRIWDDQQDEPTRPERSDEPVFTDSEA